MVETVLDFMANYAAWSAFKATTITFLTAIVAVVMAAVLLILRKEVLKDEDWLMYLGLAFAVFPVQYSLRALAYWERISDPEREGLWKLVETVAQAVFSNLNSLFLLCAALALLYRLPHTWWKTRWILLLVPFLVSGTLGMLLESPWDRFLEALLSGLCLVAVSWAMFESSGTRQRRGWAFFILVGGFLYACLHVVYAFVPNLAAWNTLADRVGKKMQVLWWTELPPRTVVEALDSGVFGLAVIFKASLFVGALLVIMRCLSAFSLAVVEEVLEPVKNKRGDFLLSHGILRAVAESIGADLVALCTRLPGDKKDQIAISRWLRDPSLNPDLKQEDLCNRPGPEISTIGKVLSDGKFVHSHEREEASDFQGGRGYWEVPGMHSLVNVPLRFHGAVVGCLSFEWKGRGAFTATDVKRIHQAAEFLTPVVQAERWLWAGTQLRTRLRPAQATTLQDERLQFLPWLVETLQDVLSPRATSAYFDFGFYSQKATCGAEDDDDLRVEVVLGFRGASIGRLLLAVERDADPLDRPSLTEDPRQLEVIATMVRDAIFDQCRAQLGQTVSRLHKTLGSLDLTSYQEWWKALEAAALEAGLLWLWADPERIPGLREWLSMDAGAIVSSLHDSEPLHVGQYKIFDRRDAQGETKTILALQLQASGKELYVGMARPAFRLELAAELPWAGFLERFAEAADLALVRIRAIELETEALQFEMNDLLVHELRSPAEEFAIGVEWLREEFLRDGSLAEGDPRLRTLEALEKSARQFLELAGSVLKSFSLDGRNSIPLVEVLKKVSHFYEGRLAAQSIGLSWAADPAWVIEVPFDVAYLVLMTLVRNSRDAIHAGRHRPGTTGKISVSTEATEHNVACHVDDDGCGIPEELRGRLFRLGFSTKSRGSGRGLALARRALVRYGGSLELASQPPLGVSTRMSVTFPRSTS
ncbi:MAG TPA: hypothetical protein DD490_14090 [Acidobacteria bacterium]|nr:hypothetical protein [Acidobacteriota bacterium]